ncbi:MAG: hypothetical protein ACXWET_05285 [Halobacteriota archaeon]
MQPFVYRKDVAGEEFERRDRHMPARRDRTLTAKVANGDVVADRTGTYLGVPSR